MPGREARARQRKLSPAGKPRPAPGRKRPNVVRYVADEFRWDFVGGYGLNPTTRTPNLNKSLESGSAFSCAVTNQPLSSPSRACMMRLQHLERGNNLAEEPKHRELYARRSRLVENYSYPA